MRAVRNLVAPPIVIITDSKEFAFNFPTRYRIDVSKIIFTKMCIAEQIKKEHKQPQVYDNAFFL